MPEFSTDEVQRMIDEALSRDRTQRQQEIDDLRSSHAQEMENLRASLAGTGPASFVPAHSAGPGTETAATWSLYEQELARVAGHSPEGGTQT